jgi:D-alanyl-lipoteichoic acid acyltransferase DltB (MBOAT superfamily)
MVFNSLAFGVFFLVVYGLYLAVHPRVRPQNVLLLAASYFFYGWWDWRFLGLLLLTTCVDYVTGLALDRRDGADSRTKPDAASLNRNPSTRKWILVVSLAVNLGVLGAFKYFNFFVDSWIAALHALGVPASPRTWDVILPVGISFYTFQSMSYSIDVYRGSLPAARHFLDFALFVSFFPQLVAGPIVRAADLLPQLERPRRLRLETFYEGAFLMFWGLFKKAVLADNLSPIVDRAFASASAPAGPVALLAVYAFALQIYCDFSGYTDIARGCAKTMGFEFDLNFKLPYWSTNPSEFWRRWHISLSTWLRDYLYVPLGGNRKGPLRTQVNLILTMTLGGLWHGAAWTFVVWGLYHGLLLAAYRLVSPGIGPPRTKGPLHRFLAGLVLFHLVCMGWVFFRADTLSQAAGFFLALASAWPAGAIPMSDAATFAACALPLALIEYVQYRKNDLTCVLRCPAWVRGAAYACLFHALILWGGRIHKPFIYFQF